MNGSVEPATKRMNGAELDRKVRLATRASLLEVVTLQDRWTTVRIAVRTKEMTAIRAMLALLQRIHHATGWRSVEIVSLKLVLRLLNALQFVLKEQGLRFHKTALSLRLLNCSGDLFEGRFDLRFASTLRRLDKIFQAPHEAKADLHGPANISGALGKVVHGLEIETFHFLTSWQDFQRLSRAVLADASGPAHGASPSPDQATPGCKSRKQSVQGAA